MSRTCGSWASSQARPIWAAVVSSAVAAAMTVGWSVTLGIGLQMVLLRAFPRIVEGSVMPLSVWSAMADVVGLRLPDAGHVRMRLA